MLPSHLDRILRNAVNQNVCVCCTQILDPRTSQDHHSPSFIPGNSLNRNKDGDHLWRTSRDLDYIDQVSEQKFNIIHYMLHEINY